MGFFYVLFQSTYLVSVRLYNFNGSDDMPKIYIDVLMIISFAGCFCLLGITACISHYKLRKARHLTASLVGAFSCLSIITANLWAIAFIKLFFLMFSIMLAFSTISLKRICRILAIYLICNTVFMSVIYILWHLSRSKTIYIINYTVYFDVSLLMLIFSIALSYTLLSVVQSVITSSKLKRDVYRLDVRIKDKEFSFRGVADTGNFVKDVISKRSVIVCKSRNMCKAFGLNDEIPEGFYMLPINTACGHSVMYAVKPQEAQIKSFSGFNKSVNVTIGIVDSDDGDLAIFNPDILI